MTFRTKLLVVSSLTVAGAVALVTGTVSIITRRSFERMIDDQRRGVLAQFGRQMESQSRDVEAKVARVVATDDVLKVAVEANHSDPDFSGFLGLAAEQAQAQALDFLDILQQDGTIISSAHQPAAFGRHNEWLISDQDRTSGKAFLTRIPVSDGSAVALAAVRTLTAGDRVIVVVGARRLDPAFLASLAVMPGMRALLWLPGRRLGRPAGSPRQAEWPEPQN